MVVHYIGSRLGGPSYVSFVLDQTKKNPQPQLRSPDELAEGFAYIKELVHLGLMKIRPWSGQRRSELPKSLLCMAGRRL